MSFQDRIKQHKPVKPSVVEQIDIWISQLDKEEQLAAYELLSNAQMWTAKEVVTAFAAEGYRLTEKTVYSWRKENHVTV